MAATKCAAQQCHFPGVRQWGEQQEDSGEVAIECEYGGKTAAPQSRKVAQEQLNYSCPLCWESMNRGHKFAVILDDLHQHRIYEFFEEKDTKPLESNLSRFRGSERGKVVCMNLSWSFRNIVQSLFLKARIVTD